MRSLMTIVGRIEAEKAAPTLGRWASEAGSDDDDDDDDELELPLGESLAERVGEVGEE